MKVLERYYQKVYNCTNRLLKKVFGLDVNESMKELRKIKSEIEDSIKKSIGEITTEDLIKHKLSIQYCKYRTLDSILSVLSGATFLKSFCDEDMEEIANEG